jgi:hypothetical protein
MKSIQKTGRGARKGSGALWLRRSNILIVALVIAAALLAACGAAGNAGDAGRSQEGDKPTQATAAAGKEGSEDGPKAFPPDDGAGETGGTSGTTGENSAGLEDSRAGENPADGAKTDGRDFTRTDGTLITTDVDWGQDAAFLFAAEQGDLFTVHGGFDLIDKNGKPLDKSSLKAGARLRVEYDLVLESYPGQIAPRTVQVMSEGDDMTGFYLTVLDKIWNEDAALNPGQGGTLAFDLEETGNLTEGEKNALILLAGSRFGVQGFASTYEKLVEEGSIDGKLLQFKDENSMLIRISTSDVRKDRFKFKVSKWVSGTGADWYDNCVATKTGGAWSFELGGFAVS